MHRTDRSTATHESCRAPTQRGFTLAETLGALMILAMVVLGISALHLENRRLAKGVDLRDRAALLAAEMSAQIRAERDPKTRYETAIGITCNSPATKTNATLKSVACWQEKVAAELPSGSGRITRELNGTTPVYTIMVSWSQPRTGTASYVAWVTTQ
jgi:type IV pilus modification protein PilV